MAFQQNYLAAVHYLAKKVNGSQRLDGSEAADAPFTGMMGLYSLLLLAMNRNQLDDAHPSAQPRDDFAGRRSRAGATLIVLRDDSASYQDGKEVLD